MSMPHGVFTASSLPTQLAMFNGGTWYLDPNQGRRKDKPLAAARQDCGYQLRGQARAPVLKLSLLTDEVTGKKVKGDY